jgi:Ca-activated chloride channel family protein
MTLRPKLAALFTLAVLTAQDGPIRVDVRLVEVYATVLDQKGRYVDGLSPERFEVIDEGRPQKIRDFESTSSELSCALLLDTTGSMRPTLPAVKNAAVKLIDELGPRDAVAVMRFDDHLTVLQDFTTDKAVAKNAVLRTRAMGATALFDAIAQTARQVSSRHGKKAILVFTDGDDNSSVLNGQSAIMRARKLGVPVYAVAEGDALKSKPLLKNLENLATSTGGAFYTARDGHHVGRIFEDISYDLQHSYMLTFSPEPPPPDDRWRTIRVRIKGEGHRVVAREGYAP